MRCGSKLLTPPEPSAENVRWSTRPHAVERIDKPTPPRLGCKEWTSTDRQARRRWLVAECRIMSTCAARRRHVCLAFSAPTVATACDGAPDAVGTCHLGR